MNPFECTVGQTVGFTIAYFDTNGNPMNVTPTSDSPPTWSDDNTAVGDLSQSADGNTAQETLVGPGNDDVTVSLSVGGVEFTATLTLTATASGGGQTLGSIEIVPTIAGGSALPSARGVKRAAVRR